MLESHAPDAEAFAQQTGMTFNGSAQSGGVKTTGVMSDRDKALVAQLPQQWEFTDKRPNSPTAGMTFYVGVGTPLADIQRRYQQKAAEWIEMSKPKARV